MTKFENIVTKDFWEYSFKQMDAEEGWELETSTNEIKVYVKKLFDNEPLKAQKIICTAPYPLDIVMKVFTEVDIRAKYNPNVVQAKRVFVGENYDVIFQEIQSPFMMISNRDALICRSIQKVENGYDIVMKSTTSDDYPEKDGVVRSELIICAMRYRVNKENKDHTDMIQVNQMNVNGWIPTFVNQWVSKSLPIRGFEGLKKGCEFFLNEK